MCPQSQRVKRFPLHQSLSKMEIETWDVVSGDESLPFFMLVSRFCLLVLRGIPTHRSWVRKIRFAPGKGNQKLIAMYNDGAEVWDTKEVGPAPRVFAVRGAAPFHFTRENCVMGPSDLE